MRYTSCTLEGRDPLDHLAIENMLLETKETEQVLLVFYVNGPSVIIGRNQNPWREVAPDAQVPFFRRASGGGAVYHDEGNLNWAFIAPRHLHDQDAELVAVARGISACGVETAPGSRGGIYCTTASGYGGRKVSGTARRFTPRSVLHHGTVLVCADMKRLRTSLGGIETRDDHSIASVPASPINLGDIVPGLTVRQVLETMSLSITGGPSVALPLGLIDSAMFEEEKLRLSSPAWAYGASPPFTVEVECGGRRAALGIRAGLLERVEHAGSVLDLDCFIGREFSIGLLEEIQAALDRRAEGLR
jgi:lipoate-protein ligase A